jgi:hypothetical protein
MYLKVKYSKTELTKLSNIFALQPSKSQNMEITHFIISLLDPSSFTLPHVDKEGPAF